MKLKIVVCAALLLLAAGCQKVSSVAPEPGPGVACTEEAKMCADGSSVGRTGPMCEFAACPDMYVTPKPTPSASGVEGSITIGPSCPVLRDPPESGCADKPYVATVKVMNADGKTQVGEFVSSTNGAFKFGLAPGEYVLVPVGGRVYPQASSQTVVVKKDAFAHVSIQFDSGIR